MTNACFMHCFVVAFFLYWEEWIESVTFSRAPKMFGFYWVTKGGFKSEDTLEFLHCQDEYYRSLSWAENSNSPPKSVINLFKFSSQDSNLEYLFWKCKNSSDLKPPLNWELKRSSLLFLRSFIFKKLLFSFQEQTEEKFTKGPKLQ